MPAVPWSFEISVLKVSHDLSVREKLSSVFWRREPWKGDFLEDKEVTLGTGEMGGNWEEGKGGRRRYSRLKGHSEQRHRHKKPKGWFQVTHHPSLTEHLRCASLHCPHHFGGDMTHGWSSTWFSLFFPPLKDNNKMYLIPKPISKNNLILTIYGFPSNMSYLIFKPL